MAYSADHTHIELGIVRSFIKEILDDNVGAHHRVPRANAEALHAFLEEEQGSLPAIEYEKGTEIVHEGQLRIASASIPDLDYSHVPLGLILKGSVVVLRGDRATKTLSTGDFIGVFETSDWLLTGRSRHIGEWSLVADADTQIAFFGGAMLLKEEAAAQSLRDYLIEFSRTDSVPQPISSLPLLDWIACHTTRSRLPECAIVVHTHLLPNSYPLFRHLSHLVSPGRIFILEKPYSTIRSVFDNLVRSGYDVTQVRIEEGMPYEFATQKSTEILWRKVVHSQKKHGFKKILVVDDGGDLWLSIPWAELEGVEIAGVEQTQRGIARIEHANIQVPPIVSVASSGIKKLIESEFIGAGVVKKLAEFGAIDAARNIGILGAGSIGRALERALESIGRSVIFYDPLYHPQGVRPDNAVGSIDVLLNSCDLIIGTVGTDSVVGAALERVSGTKILASASSADVEFASLLKLADSSPEPFATRTVKVHEDLDIQILNGGYPINFDRTVDSTPDEDIVLTRCLMYIGVMQAVELLNQHEQASRLYALDKVSQAHLLRKWIETKRALGQKPGVEEGDIERIVSYTSLKNPVETATVWED